MLRHLRIFLVVLLPVIVRAAEPVAAVEPVPADLPLRAAAPSAEPWLQTANVLQPYAHSQFTALTHLGDRPARLKKEFGFNAIIVLPPDAHNVLTDVPMSASEHLTEAQFREGIAAYRAAGYRLMLYTSVMACGMCPEFQSGQIAREHPDWLQRDPKGNPVMVYGVPWLCPSSPARELALERAVHIAREYQADGILLDNNQFYFAKDGWTCHCDHCTRGFRDYVKQRFGVDRAKRFFGATPDKIEIPTEEGPLFALWLHWRNRVWAEVNESFRARLRQVNPHLMLFANTQYGFKDAVLGTDLQYEHEDVVLSESTSPDSWVMSEKMALGATLATGRPLWNYIGTFVKSDYTGLKPPEVVGPLIAATIAHQARPWIVDGFDDGPTDPRARREMSKLLAWHDTHPELFTNTPWSRVGVVISLGSRNALHSALIPPDLAALFSAGIPATGLRDDELTLKKIQPFRVITLETSVCLDKSAAQALAQWVRAGGTLIASPEAGSHDELGRALPRSVLWKALDLKAAPTEITKVGLGKLVAPSGVPAFATAAVNLARADSFLAVPGCGAEVLPYLSKRSLVLHLVGHGAATQPVVLRLPNTLKPRSMTAELFTPDATGSEMIPIVTTDEGVTLSLAAMPAYGVITIPLR